MKNCILMLCLFSSLVITGCKPKYIDLTQKAFLELDASKVKEVDAVFENRFHAGDRWLKMRGIFPIKDPDKISTVINCIKKADFGTELNNKKILYIDIVEVSFDRKKEKGFIPERNIFKKFYSFSDPNIIDVINTYIAETNSTPGAIVDDVIPFNRLYFKTNKTTYFIRFLWDKKSVYGDWWESPELLKKFREWDPKFF